MFLAHLIGIKRIWELSRVTSQASVFLVSLTCRLLRPQRGRSVAVHEPLSCRQRQLSLLRLWGEEAPAGAGPSVGPPEGDKPSAGPCEGAQSAMKCSPWVMHRSARHSSLGFLSTGASVMFFWVQLHRWSHHPSFRLPSMRRPSKLWELLLRCRARAGSGGAG